MQCASWTQPASSAASTARTAAVGNSSMKDFVVCGRYLSDTELSDKDGLPFNAFERVRPLLLHWIVCEHCHPRADPPRCAFHSGSCAFARCGIIVRSVYYSQPLTILIIAPRRAQLRNGAEDQLAVGRSQDLLKRSMATVSTDNSRCSSPVATRIEQCIESNLLLPSRLPAPCLLITCMPLLIMEHFSPLLCAERPNGGSLRCLPRGFSFTQRTSVFDPAT